MRAPFPPFVRYRSEMRYIAICVAISFSHALMAKPAQITDASSNAPPVITLNEAIDRARVNDPNIAAAGADAKITALDRSISRAALLPNAVYHNQYLYTQGTGTGGTVVAGGSQTTAPIFIANNAVHEYTSQAAVTETLGLQSAAEVRLADATAARSAAEYEIARRGLVAAVVGLYYNLTASEHKVVVAQRASNEAAGFTDLTSKREAAREVAHADVVKAQLQQQQRERDLADAKLAADKARLELGVLLFPDPLTSYATETTALPAMPSRADVETQAAAHNPELKSALAAVHMSDAEVLGARAAYLPDLALNFNYGIDAAQFATKGPGGANNLGYSASATVDIPVWDWLATQHRVKQTEIRRDAARVALTATQRHLIAALDEAYAEAAEAQRQAASLELSAQTAAESLRLTKLRYTAGEASALEVVDAQTSLTAAENAREDGVVRYESGLANLQVLTGTL
jgi:outer membrane protein TolC